MVPSVPSVRKLILFLNSLSHNSYPDWRQVSCEFPVPNNQNFESGIGGWVETNPSTGSTLSAIANPSVLGNPPTTATVMQAYSGVGATDAEIAIPFCQPPPAYIGYYHRRTTVAGYTRFGDGTALAISHNAGSDGWTDYVSGFWSHTYAIPVSGPPGPPFVGDWIRFEYKNINWPMKTYDIYVNGALHVTGANFADSKATGVNLILFIHPYSGRTADIDDIVMR